MGTEGNSKKTSSIVESIEKTSNYNQVHTENMLWHQKCNELQLAGLAKYPACGWPPFLAGQQKVHTHWQLPSGNGPSEYPWMGWTLVEPWLNIGWTMLNRWSRLKQMTACHWDMGPLAITPMTGVLGISKAVAICHWPWEIAIHVELTRRFLEFGNNMEQLILILTYFNPTWVVSCWNSQDFSEQRVG